MKTLQTKKVTEEITTKVKLSPDELRKAMKEYIIKSVDPKLTQFVLLSSEIYFTDNEDNRIDLDNVAHCEVITFTSTTKDE